MSGLERLQQAEAAHRPVHRESLLSRFKEGCRRFKAQLPLQGMVLPGIVWLIIFCYVPMYGIIIAFKDFRITEGFFAGPWVGLKHFDAFFSDPFALKAITNTLIISALKLVFGFPAPIIFALLLNEVRSLMFKRVAQTVSYLPFFISWVVMVSLMQTILSLDGPLNSLLMQLGLIHQRISFLAQPELFRAIAVLSDLWKGIGWGSIIYLAAISSIPQDMYESAYMDGANRFQRIIHITIPSIMPTIVILLILSVSGILGSNFEQHFLLGNKMVSETAETIDTYVFRTGIQAGRYSYATAIGLACSIVSFFLLISADRIARLMTKGEKGLF
ncbi:ABC transporter permease [Cohnella nanjingensis]|uniref:Sugar ABC transporter permease n=1 Tax=Cohnella nanjingensis TaxID=1387779 RepID=A0A7X0VDX0_9BACL|nr:ABC transporter permease subunit [Cohnella nanjingensis]MBB6670121.1 sugar ABC transporter permease [Cohnella nanjingensis]